MAGFALTPEDTGEVFLNLERQDWNTLASRLSAIYRMRQNRTLYLVADAGVPFQRVADALDTVENIASTAGSQADGRKKDKLDIRVRLVTPKVFDAGCVVTSSGHRVLK